MTPAWGKVAHALENLAGPVRRLNMSMGDAALAQHLAAWWEDLGELRNTLVHEYAMGDAQRAELLKRAWHQAPMLLDEIRRIETLVKAQDL